MSSSQRKLWGLHSYFPSVLYIDVIHICKKNKKNECGIYKKMKKILVTFWGYADNSNKGLIYPYTFMYIIIILIYQKNYFHLYTISKKKSIMKNSIFLLVA